MTPEENLLKEEYGIEAFNGNLAKLEISIKYFVDKKIQADATIAKIKEVSKIRQPRKSYKSPYSKFDKYHKKKRK